MTNEEKQKIENRISHLEILIDKSLDDPYDDWESRLFWRKELNLLKEQIKKNLP